MRMFGLSIVGTGLLVASGFGAVAGAQGSKTEVVIVKAASLIDGRGGTPLRPAMVRIEGDRGRQRERVRQAGGALAPCRGE